MREALDELSDKDARIKGMFDLLAMEKKKLQMQLMEILSQLKYQWNISNCVSVHCLVTVDRDMC